MNNSDLPAKSRKMIAGEYGISTRTLRRWLKEAGIIVNKGKYIFPCYIKIIYEKFGVPKYFGI